MTPLGVILEIQSASLAEKAAALFIYKHCEPSSTRKEALAFARHILSQLDAGVQPQRIADLWCLRCWSPQTNCGCRPTPSVSTGKDKPECMFPKEWFDEYGNFKPEVLESQVNSE